MVLDPSAAKPPKPAVITGAHTATSDNTLHQCVCFRGVVGGRSCIFDNFF